MNLLATKARAICHEGEEERLIDYLIHDESDNNYLEERYHKTQMSGA